MPEYHIRIAKQGDLVVLPRDGKDTISKAGGYTCIHNCGRLVWVNGKQVAKHFRHYRKSPTCPSNTRDGSVHEASMSALVGWFLDAINDSKVKTSFITACDNCDGKHWTSINVYGKPYKIDVNRNYTTQSNEKFQYDIALIDKNSDRTVLAIEVLSSNAVHQTKETILNSNEVNWIEIGANQIIERIQASNQSIQLDVINHGVVWGKDVSTRCSKDEESHIFDSAEYILNMKSLQIKKLYDKGWEKVKSRNFLVPNAMFVKKFPLYDGKVFLNLDPKRVRETDSVLAMREVGNIKYLDDKDCLMAYTFKIFRSWKKIEHSTDTENTRLRKELAQVINICFAEVESIGFKPLIDYAKSDARVGLKPQFVHKRKLTKPYM